MPQSKTDIYPSARCLRCGMSTSRKENRLPGWCTCGGVVIRAEAPRRKGRHGYYARVYGSLNQHK